MTKLKGIKLSLKENNLYLGKLSYRYGNKKLKPRLNPSLRGKGDNFISLGNSPRDIKINIERSVSGFESKLVKEEWKSRFISKQLLKSYYDLSEKEYKDLRQKTGLEYSEQLIEHLERRLDVILFRLNWASSLGESHHLVKKGYIYITDKKGEWMEHPVAHSRMYISVGTLISLTRPIDSVKLNESEALRAHTASYPAKPHYSGAEHPVNKIEQAPYTSHLVNAPTGVREQGGPEEKEQIIERIIRVKALHNLVFRAPFDPGKTRKVKSFSHRQNDRNQVSWLKKIDYNKARQIRENNNKLYTSNWEAMLLYNPVFKEILLPIPLDTKKLS